MSHVSTDSIYCLFYGCASCPLYVQKIWDECIQRPSSCSPPPLRPLKIAIEIYVHTVLIPLLPPHRSFPPFFRHPSHYNTSIEGIKMMGGGGGGSLHCLEYYIYARLLLEVWTCLIFFLGENLYWIWQRKKGTV